MGFYDFAEGVVNTSKTIRAGATTITTNVANNVVNAAGVASDIAFTAQDAITDFYGNAYGTAYGAYSANAEKVGERAYDVLNNAADFYGFVYGDSAKRVLNNTEATVTNMANGATVITSAGTNVYNKLKDARNDVIKRGTSLYVDALKAELKGASMVGLAELNGVKTILNNQATAANTVVSGLKTIGGVATSVYKKNAENVLNGAKIYGSTALGAAEAFAKGGLIGYGEYIGETAYDTVTGLKTAAENKLSEYGKKATQAAADFASAGVAAVGMVSDTGDSVKSNITNSIEKITELDKTTSSMSGNYILPGSGVQVNSDSKDPLQSSPLLQYYSPRLFGAPPQLTNQCDMRILSSNGYVPGAVGDFYLTKILQDANIAYFSVGRARFLGGFASKANVIKQMAWYALALKRYNIYGNDGTLAVKGSSAASRFDAVASEEAYKSAYGVRDDTDAIVKKDDDGNVVLDVDAEMADSGLLSALGDVFATGVGGLSILANIKNALSVQQPFYTFESDWRTYINNVKMMINTAVIMLGLQSACVRMGDYYYPIGMKVKIEDEFDDVWANYRYITLTRGSKGLGDVTATDTMNGDTTQYVSFMIDPSSVSENISNTIGQSQIYSTVINSGSSVGSEIAFLTNSTAGSTNDKVISLSKDSKAAAEKILKKMSSGNGRFTAAIASSMARSFTGDHTIYPEVFQGSSSTSSMSMTVHLTSDSGDPYAYLINILVPTFFILGMALPALSANNASAYSYPPVIQCNIPGMWGTRLGMIESVSFNKNPQGKDVSINGYPLQVDVTINVKDLEHTLVTTPMDKPSMFLNNQTMFDYIAQISGVDKYKVNGSMRTIARLALASSAAKNAFDNIGDALLTDWHMGWNKFWDFNRQ